MDIATISFLVLGFIAVAVVSYLAGRSTAGYDVDLLRAELEGQKLARKEQTRKYDELYDSFLRLNKYNTSLSKEMQKYKNTYRECADEVYALFLRGVSRKELCELYPSVAYSTICNWIIKKRKEALNDCSVNPNDSVQGKLL